MLFRSVDSLEKTLMLGGIGGRRRRPQRMRWLDGIIDSMDMSLGELRARGRSGGLVFPSLSEFSTVYCDPQGHANSQT